MTKEMEGKLLHERLRGYVKASKLIGDFPIEHAIHEEIDEDDLNLYEKCCFLFEKWAEEIEKYYAPRPRFEDGEPVQFRETDVLWNTRGDHNPEALWMVSAINESGMPIANGVDEIIAFAEMTEDGFVKRKQIRVLDYDGELIKSGDTVYTKCGVERVVQKAGTDACEGMEDWDGSPWVMFNNGHWMYAKDLSHKKPTLDRDDEPINVGDIVFNIYTDNQYEVLGIAGNGYSVYLKSTSDNCNNIYLPRYYITHQKPDTQEKIENDALKTYDAYWNCCRKDCRNCPSKIDDKKPHERYKTSIRSTIVDQCKTAQILDLLRRQRELDQKKNWRK